MAVPIQEIADKVVAQIDDEDHDVFIDQFTIMLVCSILSAIFNAARLYCEWKRGQEADGMHAVCVRPNFVQRRMVMNQIAKTDKKNKLSFRQRRVLAQAVFDTGKNATVAEIQDVIDSEANGWYGEWLV